MKFLKLTKAQAKKLCAELPKQGDSRLTPSGANLYYRKGYGYFVSGYSYSGQDVLEDIKIIFQN